MTRSRILSFLQVENISNDVVVFRGTIALVKSRPYFHKNMNTKSVRLLIVTGLPGSGKSHLIKTKLRNNVTGLCVEDFHANAIDHSPAVEKSRHFTALQEALRAGHDCIIADIEFCHRERREVVAYTFKSVLPEIEIEYHCLRNQLERCKSNIERRGRNGLQEEKRKAEALSKIYEIPNGAIEYDVWDS